MPRFIGKVVQDQLVRRFALAYYPEVVDPFLLSKVVHLVSDADKLMIDNKGIQADSVDTLGAVVKDLHIVPGGKRWKLRIINIVRNSGNGTFTEVYLKDSTTGKAIPLRNQAAGTSWYSGVLNEIYLEESDIIQVYQDAAVGATVWRATIWIEEENMYP